MPAFLILKPASSLTPVAGHPCIPVPSWALRSRSPQTPTEAPTWAGKAAPATQSVVATQEKMLRVGALGPPRRVLMQTETGRGWTTQKKGSSLISPTP